MMIRFYNVVIFRISQTMLVCCGTEIRKYHIMISQV